MVYFREHRWLPVHGQSRVSARISPQVRTRDKVHWALDLHYIAGGAAWRRVEEWERPKLWVGVSGFFPGLKSWKDLERLNFWEFPGGGDDEDEDYDAWLDDDRGFMDVEYRAQGSRGEGDHTFVNDHLWRVAAREGGLFTVELAGFADGRDMLRSLKQEALVTADGKEEPPEPEADFWKKHAELYLVENVPFGTVTVEVPRNVRDAESYALRRARELLGTGEPERIEVKDYFKWNGTCPESIRDDVFVDLHFHGSYEE